MTEKQYDENWAKAKLKKLLDAAGVFHVPISSNGMGVSGIADRLGVKDSVFIAVEVKRPGRRGQAHRGCSALQAKFLASVSAKGGISFVFDGEADDATLLGAILDSGPQLHAGLNNLEMDYWKKK